MTEIQSWADLTEEELSRLAHVLASLLKPEDILALSGELGAGKSVFARALIRTAMGNEALDVPSPTYTLIQPYQPTAPYPEILHVDLYRLKSQAELRELGLDDTGDAVLAIEWPEKMGASLSSDALWIRIGPGSTRTTRNVLLEGTGSWGSRLKNLRLVRA